VVQGLNGAIGGKTGEIGLKMGYFDQKLQKSPAAGSRYEKTNVFDWIKSPYYITSSCNRMIEIFSF
jgi:hypothetical protein